MKGDAEMNLMRTIAKRLERTEQEIEALGPEVRERVKAYLRGRFGWFTREKAVPPESVQ